MKRAAILLALVIARPAHADDACDALDAAAAEAPDDLAQGQRAAACHEDLGQLATAWAAWRDVKARARAAGDTKTVALATEHITAIEPRLAHLTLSMPRGVDAPDGLTVALDGEPVALDDLGSAAAIDQGDHRITADAPGYAAWSRELFVDNGAFKTVTIELVIATDEAPPPDGAPEVEPPGDPAHPTRPAAPSQTRRWLGLGAAGAGVVVLGVGAWAGLSAKGLRDDARALGCSDDLSSCPATAIDTADAAYARANLATGLIIGGAVVAAVGVVLWLTAPDAAPAADHVALDLGADHATVGFTTSF